MSQYESLFPTISTTLCTVKNFKGFLTVQGIEMWKTSPKSNGSKPYFITKMCAAKPSHLRFMRLQIRPAQALKRTADTSRATAQKNREKPLKLRSWLRLRLTQSHSPYHTGKKNETCPPGGRSF